MFDDCCQKAAPKQPVDCCAESSSDFVEQGLSQLSDSFPRISSVLKKIYQEGKSLLVTPIETCVKNSATQDKAKDEKKLAGPPQCEGCKCGCGGAGGCVCDSQKKKEKSESKGAASGYYDYKDADQMPPQDRPKYEGKDADQINPGPPAKKTGADASQTKSAPSYDYKDADQIYKSPEKKYEGKDADQMN